MANITHQGQSSMAPNVNAEGELPSIRDQANVLCDSCSELRLTMSDFECVLTTYRPLLERTLAELKSTKDCRLCSLIVYAVEDTRLQWDVETLHADEEVVCKARLQQYMYPTSKPFNIINIVTNFAFHGPSYGMQLYPVGASNHPNVLLGREVDRNAIPVSLIQSWVQDCCHSHQDTCEVEDDDYAQIADKLLLIDVRDNCIVPAPDRSRYVALSYVWGQTKQAELTSSNKNVLMLSNGLLSIAGTIPQVVRDAVELTRKIGERYLWVDNLCIIQNDDATKLPLIERMNLIYKHALLTVFAASSGDASDGLPGLNSKSRQPEQAMAIVSPGFSLFYPLSHVKLEASKWAMRGWTFQEYYFSRRRLIFLNGIVYFRCCSCSWREDLALETFNAQIDQLDLSIGFKGRSEHWEPPGVFQNIIDIHSAYVACVQAYTSRNLTYDADTLQAFAGITSSFSFNHGLLIYQGLIRVLLLNDLFWQPETTMERKVLFPSWSWAGWKGRIWMPRLSPDVYILSSFTAWYVWNPRTSLYEFASGTTFDAVDAESSRIQLQLCNLTLTEVLQMLIQLWRSVCDNQKSHDVQFHKTGGCQTVISALAQMAYPNLDMLPETRSKLSTQGTIGSATLLFRAPVTTMWLSARAPNAELAHDTGPRTHRNVILQPALYLYSILEPELRMLGIAWINSNTAFSEIRKQTSSASMDIDSAEMKPDRFCQPLVTTWRDVDTPANSEEAKASLKEMLFKFGVIPDDATFSLPEDPRVREKFLLSRRIEKVKVAILSGPVEGDARNRYGVPMSFPYTGFRRFLRVLILKKIENINSEDGQPCFHYERLGTGELELGAVDHLGDLAFEDIVLG